MHQLQEGGHEHRAVEMLWPNAQGALEEKDKKENIPEAEPECGGGPGRGNIKKWEVQIL